LRPTGRLHIGHYFANIQPALDGADLLIATFHAPDERFDVMPTLARFGVQNVVRQEDVFNAELYFRLLGLASAGDLERMTQYKSSNEPTAHLFVYPVLMVHDVAGYDEVIVGEDQTQHLEFARRLLKRYNKHYGQNLRVPTASPIAGRIMSFTDPTSKMSKSEPQGCLFLDDSHEEVAAKIRRATMTAEGRENVIDLYRRLGGLEPIPEMNQPLKELLTEQVLKIL